MRWWGKLGGGGVTPRRGKFGGGRLGGGPGCGWGFHDDVFGEDGGGGYDAGGVKFLIGGGGGGNRRSSGGGRGGGARRGESGRGHAESNLLPGGRGVPSRVL